ncbi:MAG: transglycosylase domain-containing protein [Eubacterium sp.]|nr:transglycosylase domain-containing protein [Eubacterium sp.]
MSEGKKPLRGLSRKHQTTVNSGVSQEETPQSSKAVKTKGAKIPFRDLPPGKKILRILLTLVIALAAVGVIAFAVLYARVPELDVANFNYIQNARILDKDGQFYQELQGSERREVVSIDQIPEDVQNAFIAIEDQRFRSHHGVDFPRFIKALLGVVSSGSLDGPGGSTITQQLIKLTHLTSEKTIDRKFQEVILALRLEKVYSKDQILEAYLNKINLSQAWGVQAASKVFFNKDVSQLDIAQAAILAAIANSPSYYDPYTYVTDEDGITVIDKDDNGNYILSENNKSRAYLVIDKMLELGYIDQGEYDTAYNELATNNVGLTYVENQESYSYFTDAVYEAVLDDLMETYDYTEAEASEYLLNGGLTIESTVDPKVQGIMETCAKDDSLYPAQSGAAAAASEAQSADTGESYNYIPQVGMTIIDNETGYVAGIVGGREDKTNLSLNRATQKFQPGSSTKPLTTYGPGLDTGAITLASVFQDVPISYQGWTPQNAEGGNGGATTVREGITASTNIVAVQANLETGINVSADYAEKLGLEIVRDGDKNDLNPAALALGGYTNGQSTLAMASAFSTFPNMGEHKEAVFYTRVTDPSGEVILENKTESEKIFKAQTAYLITDALKGVVQGGTTTVSVAGQPVAGKTGTTDENRHAWFCGYTPYYSMAVWYGYDNNVVETSQGTYYLNIGVFGGSKPGPAYMFEEVMNQVHEDLPASDFAANPGGISTASVDKVSGKLATELTAQDPRGNMTVTEMFIDGTAPTQRDDVHINADLCSTTNAYATSHCPDHKTVCRVKATSPHYPEGVTPLQGISYEDPNIYAPDDGQTCPIHTSANNTEINLMVSGGAVGGTINMARGRAIVLVANGPSNASTAFSASSGSISVNATGNQATLTATSTGTATLTVTQKMPYTVSRGGQARSYEATFTKQLTIIVL